VLSGIGISDGGRSAHLEKAGRRLERSDRRGRTCADGKRVGIGLDTAQRDSCAVLDHKSVVAGEGQGRGGKERFHRLATIWPVLVWVKPSEPTESVAPLASVTEPAVGQAPSNAKERAELSARGVVRVKLEGVDGKWRRPALRLRQRRDCRRSARRRRAFKGWPLLGTTCPDQSAAVIQSPFFAQPGCTGIGPSAADGCRQYNCSAASVS